MRLTTAAQAGQLDQISERDYALNGDVLMEAAGALAAREILLSFMPELSRGKAIVVVGPGNNGGDALVVARHLHSAGHRDLEVLLCAPEKSRSELFKLQLKRAQALGLRFVENLRECELIIDGLFGIGLKREVKAPFKALIDSINSSRAAKVSLDTPSGLNSDTGRIEGVAVKAAMTITFGLAKPGFFVGDGPGHCGRLRVLPIGFAQKALREVATTHFLFTERLARRALPIRKDASNKSNHGHLVVMAGHPGFWGAGVLASSSAFRMGAGYVTWASFTEPLEALKQIPEVLLAKVDDEKLWGQKTSAVAIGSGLGSGADTAKLIEKLKKTDLPVVLDADGLTACVEHKLFPLPEHWVITPHSGELGRILGIEAKEVESDRFKAALDATNKVKAFVLLKGYRTVIAHKGRCIVVHSGNSALAKAGTGDVLTGMIGSLLAQGLDPLKASATGAYLHGRLADEWVRSGKDKASLSASDLHDLLPRLLAELRRSRA